MTGSVELFAIDDAFGDGAEFDVRVLGLVSQRLEGLIRG
jgi:hypothetical protein